MGQLRTAWVQKQTRPTRTTEDCTADYPGSVLNKTRMRVIHGRYVPSLHHVEPVSLVVRRI
jgi:hypothetical protein